jgi:hypothetical protein
MNNESSLDEKFNLIKRNCAEIVSEEELKELLKTKKNPVCLCNKFHCLLQVYPHS